MKDLEQAYEQLVEDGLAKSARRSFEGCVNLLWLTHTPRSVKAMLMAAVEQCNEVCPHSEFIGD